MYKSYHYNDMPKPLNTLRPAEPAHTPAEVSGHTDTHESNPLSNIFGNLKNDDIILLVIIFLLIIDDCDDKLLLVALGFIFFSGLGE